MEFDLDCYKMAGTIAGEALSKVGTYIEPGVKLVDICRYGDQYIMESVAKVYKDIKHKGICFPTSVGVDRTIGPLIPGPDNDEVVQDGSLIHVEMGCHISGYPARCGKTFIVGDVDDGLVDLVSTVRDVALNTIKSFNIEGSTNSTKKKINDIVEKAGVYLPYVADPDLRTPGIFSYQMSRGVIDGYNDDDVPESKMHKTVTHRDHEDYDFTSVDTDYDKDDVFCVDIVVCSEDTKLVPTDDRVTILRKDIDKRYGLRLKASKHCFGRFKDGFAMSIAKTDPRTYMGVRECVQHKLLIPYGVFRSKGVDLARFQFTCIVGKKGGIVVTDIF